jgi:hypothetical protein
MKPNGRYVYALHGFTVEKRTKGCGSSHLLPCGTRRSIGGDPTRAKRASRS